MLTMTVLGEPADRVDQLGAMPGQQALFDLRKLIGPLRRPPDESAIHQGEKKADLPEIDRLEIFHRPHLLAYRESEIIKLSQKLPDAFFQCGGRAFPRMKKEKIHIRKRKYFTSTATTQAEESDLVLLKRLIGQMRQDAIQMVCQA